MKPTAAPLSRALLALSLLACSGPDATRLDDAPTPSIQQAVAHLTSAEPIPVEQAQLTAARELLDDGLHAQGRLYTHTLPVQDFYGAPFVQLNVTSPRPIGDLWGFAAGLSGDEWDLHTSKWSVVTTGATRARADVSVVEKGLGTLLDLHETRKIVGAGNVARFVAPLSGILWIEDADGHYWDVTTRARVERAVQESVEGIYDDILRAGPQAFEGAVPEHATVQLAAVAADGVDLGTLGNLATQAGYAHQGSWAMPATASSLLKAGGYAQDPTFYQRSAAHKWKMKGCAFGNRVHTSSFGCGPSAFAALLDYSFSYERMKIGPCRKRYSANGRTYGCWTHQQFVHFISEAVGSFGKPRLIDYLGTCWFNGGLTKPGGFTKGAKKFISEHSVRRSLTYAHSSGVGNPGHVDEKLRVLQTARSLDNPSVVLYPIGGKVSHYSLVESWKARTATRGLFITPYNHPSKSINMGDTFSGFVGVWSIF